jgi:PIN domain nuclease of toxin-antitoxin system
VTQVSDPACIIDASALLAFLHQEPGGSTVQGQLHGALISSVNWSEVLQKAQARGLDVTHLRDDMAALGLEVVDFTAGDAEVAAGLWVHTRAFGLSLGDRACLALGLRVGLPVLTADRTWQQFTLDVPIRSIR